jgi:hypothetical protein
MYSLGGCGICCVWRRVCVNTPLLSETLELCQSLRAAHQFL